MRQTNIIDICEIKLSLHTQSDVANHKQLKPIKMKKLTSLLGAFLFALFILSSCGGNPIEKDAKKIAELLCESSVLAAEFDETGDLAVQEECFMTMAKAKVLKEKTMKKYSSDADKKEFLNTLTTELAKCD